MKLIDVLELNNSVVLKYDSTDLCIKILTNQVINISDNKLTDSMQNYDLIQEEVSYTVETHGEIVVIKTLCIRILIENGIVEVYEMNTNKPLFIESNERLKPVLKEASDIAQLEGHTIFENDDEKIKIIVKANEDTLFYELGETGFLNKRGYTYTNYNTDDLDLHTDSFKKLYKGNPFFLVKKHILTAFFSITLIKLITIFITLQNIITIFLVSVVI